MTMFYCYPYKLAGHMKLLMTWYWWHFLIKSSRIINSFVCVKIFSNNFRMFQYLAIWIKSAVSFFWLKGVLHPDTKISMFCLFSPSSRKESILFMYGCDRCVWFKVKKHDIFSMDLRISHVERFKIFFSFSTLEITLKSTELIHAFAIVGIIPLV